MMFDEMNEDSKRAYDTYVTSMKELTAAMRKTRACFLNQMNSEGNPELAQWAADVVSATGVNTLA